MGHYDDARERHDDELNAKYKAKIGITYDESCELTRLKREIREYEAFMAIEKKRARVEEIEKKMFTFATT